MRAVRILDIGDMQNGFLRPDGKLSIPGADGIIGPANAFLEAAAKAALFDHTLVVMDTHFPGEYPGSEESRQFPIHCEYGSRDWEPAIRIPALPDIRYLMKNRFDMWRERGESAALIHDPVRSAAYANLYHFVADPRHPRDGIPRDAFLRSISPGGNTRAPEVTLFGVAADFCNRYAMEGWVARGARVTILGDLTRGIAREWPEVLAEEQYCATGPGHVRIITAEEFLEEPGFA